MRKLWMQIEVVHQALGARARIERLEQPSEHRFLEKQRTSESVEERGRQSVFSSEPCLPVRRVDGGVTLSEDPHSVRMLLIHADAQPDVVNALEARKNALRHAYAVAAVAPVHEVDDVAAGVEDL